MMRMTLSESMKEEGWGAEVVVQFLKPLEEDSAELVAVTPDKNSQCWQSWKFAVADYPYEVGVVVAAAVEFLGEAEEKGQSLRIAWRKTS